MARDTPKVRRRAVAVRGFELADADAVARLHTLPSVISGTLQLPYQSLDTCKGWLSGRESDKEKLLVAETDGRIVGEAFLHLSPHGSPRMKHVASLAMIVDDAVQGRGVGGVLLDAVIELAEKWCGVLRLEMQVWVDNTRAIRLYRSRGFVIEGVLRAFALRDGKLIDAFAMARVGENLPWPRVTAEDAASRPLPQLPSPPKRNPTAN